MQETNPQPAPERRTFDTQPPSRKKSSRKKLIVIALIFLAVLGAAAFFLFRSPAEETSEIILEGPVPQAEEQPTPTPTPTPEPVDRSQIIIRILNGTGIAREAAFLNENLEELGYTEIEVGNADEQDHETTSVAFASAVPESAREELRNKLEELYQNVQETGSAPDDVDVLITTGLRPGQTLPTPTPAGKPTPTPEATDSADSET